MGLSWSQSSPASSRQNNVEISTPHNVLALPGGDVAIALAGADERVRRVAAVGSTPNWERPGMRSLEDPDQVLDQGDPDPHARWLADHLDPSRHLDRYRRDLHITIELGREDRHIPAENAREFRRRILRDDPTAGGRIRVVVHEGLDNFGVTTDEHALRSAVDWLITPSLPADHPYRT